MKKLILAVFLLAQMIGCGSTTSERDFRVGQGQAAAGIGVVYGEAIMEYTIGKARGNPEHKQLACELLARADDLAADETDIFANGYIDSFDGVKELHAYCAGAR